MDRHIPESRNSTTFPGWRDDKSPEEVVIEHTRYLDIRCVLMNTFDMA